MSASMMTGKWVVRTAVIFGALFLVAASLVNTSSEIGAPGLATVKIVRSGLNAEALAAVAQGEYQLSLARSGGANVTDVTPQTIEFARQAFLASPLSSSSQRILVLSLLAGDDPDKARDAMELVTRLSKRDAGANLWLAQQEGQRGDLDKMITLLDRSLRTSSVANEQLMGSFVGLIAHKEAFKPIGGMLAKNPDWQNEFWMEFARNDAALPNTAAFMISNGLSLDRIKPRDRNVLFARLQRAGLLEDLYKLSVSNSRTRTNDALEKKRFQTTEEAGPFGWTLNSSGTFSTAVDRGSGNLRIDASASSYGVVAQQLVKLGGSQELALSVEKPLSKGSIVQLSAYCASDPASELAKVRVTSAQKASAINFTNTDCPFGILSLSIDFTENQQSEIVQIQHATLRPIAN